MAPPRSALAATLLTFFLGTTCGFRHPGSPYVLPEFEPNASRHPDTAFTFTQFRVAMAQFKQSGDRLAEEGEIHGDLDLHLTFRYPAGVRGGPQVQLFDIRPDLCIAVGGARHGDVVLSEDGDVATAIGVRLTYSGHLRLWCHKEGTNGAGVFAKREHLRVVSKVSVPEGGLPSGAAPSEGMTWLKPTFWYRAGRKIEQFDISDEMCLKVGGFRHGQVLKGEDGEEMVVVGARREDFLGTAGLWLHPRHRVAADAGLVPLRMLLGMRILGTQVVPEHAPPRSADILRGLQLEYTYSYPVGLMSVDGTVEFDIRDEVCMAAGGARHGDIVLSEKGLIATVVGVRIVDRLPRLWVHPEGLAGAGPHNFDEEYRVVARIEDISRIRRRRGAAPSKAVEWLQPTFWYMTQADVPLRFDIRDEVCLMVGGFRHGQVVQVSSDLPHFVVVGVQRNPQLPDFAGLWLKERKLSVAFLASSQMLRAMHAVGFQAVQEIPPPANPEPATDPELRRSKRRPRH